MDRFILSSGSMNAFQIFYYFMHSGEFFVYADSSVFICFLTLVSVWTACAVLALIYFFLTSILITIDMFAIKKCKCFPIGASHNALCIKREIYGSERIAVDNPDQLSLFEHRKFHVFFHSMLLTVNVIVIGTIAGIRYRIFGINHKFDGIVPSTE